MSFIQLTFIEYPVHGGLLVEAKWWCSRVLESGEKQMNQLSSYWLRVGSKGTMTRVWSL